MSKFILSTIGTSLLTQQIERGNKNEKDWYPKLRDTANLKLEQIPENIQKIISTLKARASQKLEQGNTKEIRLASAELNGIYGLYGEKLGNGKADMHWLVSTDTAQGLATASIVESFLQSKQLSAQVFTPCGLSAASTADFSEAIDELIIWLENSIQGYQKVCFNLVGGFKSLQAYLNTIGMFYADEIIYIFEGADSELIRIPRLPIKIDESIIEPYKREFVLMAAGTWLSRSKLSDIPESLLFFSGNDCILSNWGRLIWNRMKSQVLSQELLDYPRINYEVSFNKDYESTLDPTKRVKLQEVLAKVSYLLNKENGNTGVLKGDGGVLYDVYTNQGGIAHFRVTQGIRVSCTAKDGQLYLRHYGTEPEVNGNP
jgi:putative CRISPR-associated protein (TIGR02619 family)